MKSKIHNFIRLWPLWLILFWTGFALVFDNWIPLIACVIFFVVAIGAAYITVYFSNRKRPINIFVIGDENPEQYVEDERFEEDRVFH